MVSINWVEKNARFYQHYWGDAPDGLREHVQEMLQLLEVLDTD